MDESKQNPNNSAEALPTVEVVEIEGPRPGTLAWVQAHDLIERGTDMLPSCHRVPEDATLLPAGDGIKCRVVSASGERCKGTRLLAYGICMGHAGGGAMADPTTSSRRGAAKLKELHLTRQLLGIGPRRNGDPRYAARLRAAQRADELASAVVDGPLDDRKLSSVERQQAALKALDATFPLVTASMTLEIPDDPEQMDWQDMQSMALSLDS